MKASRIILACLSALAPALASAHVTLEQQTAMGGKSYKAVFRVGHGCDGSPTTRLTVFIPDGVSGAKPMPKAGWQLVTTDAPRRVTWSGGRLLESEYDEFIVSMSLPAKEGRLYFRVLQECEKGQNDWAEIPVEGQPAPKRPPAKLDVTAPESGMPAGHHH